jgi:MoaA/NifB/PqqE/SkfB family radical SAM enzyme
LFSIVQQAEKGTEFMRKIKVKRGDTVGIAVQQDDLPMIQFLLNGEPFHNLSINKFRGTVYPSVFLPEYESLLVKLVFDESKFKEMTPGARFGPLIVARGII